MRVEGLESIAIPRLRLRCFIGRREIADCIQTTELPNLLVIPSNQNLIGAEVELINAISREKKLKAALKKLPEDIEFVILTVRLVLAC